MSSLDPWASTTSGLMPHAIESCRAVRTEGVAPMIGAVGRNREIALAVAPLFVHAMMTAASASAAARHAAAERAAVIRQAGLVICHSTDCWRPRRLPQPA